MRWFRMYNEALDDPKVQRLSGNDFKAWVNMLMLASRHDGNIPKISDVAFAFRVSQSEAKKAMAMLYDAGLIEYVNGVARPHSWDARQYKSDTSTERVKRFRQRSGNAERNGPDTETDTEVEEVARHGGAKVHAPHSFNGGFNG